MLKRVYLYKLYEMIYFKVIAKDKASRVEKSSAKKLRIILNGPSSRDFLLDLADNFVNDGSTQYMCVNHFAMELNELFKKIKPRYYVAIDPWYVDCKEFIAALEGVDWDMVLIVNPLCGFKRITNSKISIYNLAPTEIIRGGYMARFFHMNNFCSLSLSNVSVAAVLEGVRRGFRSIEIYGLDLDNYMDMSVDANNHLIAGRVRHGYEESEIYETDLHEDYPKIVDFWRQCIRNYNSYYIIEEYAKKRNIDILNMNPDSLVDAFEKRVPYSENEFYEPS